MLIPDVASVLASKQIKISTLLDTGDNYFA